MARNVKESGRPIRGVVVEVPAGAPAGTGYAILHRGRGGDLRLSFWSPTGRLLGGVLGDPGRPVTLWPERRSRPGGDAAAAIARAKAIAARRARPVEHADETWAPPANMPAPKLPKTTAGTVRTLRKLRRRKQRFEAIALADAAVAMPLVAPGPPVPVEEGMRILESRYQAAVAEAQQRAAPRLKYPELDDTPVEEILNLL